MKCQEVMVWEGPVNMKGSLRNGQRNRYHKWRMAECHVKTEAGLKRLPKEKGAGEVKGILSNERDGWAPTRNLWIPHCCSVLPG